MTDGTVGPENPGRVVRAAVGTAIVVAALLGIENRAAKVVLLLVGAEVMLSGRPDGSDADESPGRGPGGTTAERIRANVRD